MNHPSGDTYIPLGINVLIKRLSLYVFVFLYAPGCKFKISKFLNFGISNFKTCSVPIIINTFKCKWSIV